MDSFAPTTSQPAPLSATELETFEQVVRAYTYFEDIFEADSSTCPHPVDVQSSGPPTVYPDVHHCHGSEDGTSYPDAMSVFPAPCYYSESDDGEKSVNHMHAFGSADL